MVFKIWMIMPLYISGIFSSTQLAKAGKFHLQKTGRISYPILTKEKELDKINHQARVKATNTL
ncbi:hypothetical protein [Desulfosporosinus sp. SB140]|uniref:hypothetical protein n=1 Tax=Desulfosporosinus paludis TaxID=3115649 RepID=UPI00388F635D